MRNHMRAFSVGAALAVLAWSGGAFAHDGQGPVTSTVFTLEKLTDRLYVLYGIGGNVAFYVSDDGVLVVDDQYLKQMRDGQTVEVAQGIVDQIRKVTQQPIRFLINTHHHGDHTGGNPVFVKLTTIVAHRNVRKNMLMAQETLLRNLPGTIAQTEKDLATARGASDTDKVRQLEGQLAGQKLQLEVAQSIDVRKVMPHLTYDGEVQIFLGDEDIRVLHLGRAHTDGDSLIYFSKAGVAHWGDVFTNKSHPFIDRPGGAHTGEWMKFLERGIQLAGESTRMIPGHGKVGTAEDVRAEIQYFADLRSAVEQQIKAGKSREETTGAIQLPRYKDYTGGDARLRTNAGAIYDEMKAGGTSEGAR